VLIRAGTYPEQVIAQDSGSAGNYITYAAYPGETVTIDGADLSLPTYETGLFVIEDVSYIVVSGLRIMNAGPNENNAGIYVDNAHHVIIENNSTYNTVSSGIGVWDGSNIVIDGNEVRLACNDGEQEDITVSGTDTFEVKNNHIHEGGPGTNGGEGITIKGGATDGKIYGNHVHDLTRGQRTGIYIDAWGESATSNLEVYQNTIHDCEAGITLASEDGGEVRDVKIYNNIVYDNHSNGLEIGDWGEPLVRTRPIEGIEFINNTVYNNGSEGWGAGFYNENPDVTDIVVRNNIFSQNVVSQIVNESRASLTVDHNLIDGTQEYAHAISGTDYVAGDPLFENAAGADFRLQMNSPAIDAGSSMNAPVDDFDGNPRPHGEAYDMGAYEYSLATSVDP
jgi:parallel beta-helix repeat protein